MEIVRGTSTYIVIFNSLPSKITRRAVVRLLKNTLTTLKIQGSVPNFSKYLVIYFHIHWPGMSQIIPLTHGTNGKRRDNFCTN